ncbi:MAG TPA: hypothetical protein VF111_09245 [Thermoanaerobaculia bacterium]
MRTLRRTVLLTAFLAVILTPSLFAQTDEQRPEPAPQTPPPSGQPGVLSDAASGAYERRDNLPSINLYLPEGEASIRLRKLIRNVLFESQIDYEFVNGDISTFLRYKYYARNYTYRLGVFDSVEFPDIGQSSDEGFDRVRGALVLVGVPKDYNNRYFVLMQDDALTFGDADNPDNRKNNLYLKLGYQYGTQFDERMNAIVGETRGRITPVLTAFRDIGPQKTGLAAAVTQSGRGLGADYQYTKFEAEGLRRFDLTNTSFVFSRLHVGSFVAKEEVTPPMRDRNGDGQIDKPEAYEFYGIPRYELFRLGGREALKAVDGDDALGSNEVHLTNELFVPIFRNRNFRTGAVYWNTMYGIGYVGMGTVGFEYDDITDTDRFVVDAGLGTEMALAFRDYDIYLSVVAANTLKAPKTLEGFEVRFSIRTVR